MSLWTYGKAKLTDWVAWVAAVSTWHPARLQSMLLAVLWKIRVWHIPTHPIIISMKHKEEHIRTEQRPREMCRRVEKSCIGRVEEPLLSWSATFPLSLSYAPHKWYEVLITVGRYFPPINSFSHYLQIKCVPNLWTLRSSNTRKALRKLTGTHPLTRRQITSLVSIFFCCFFLVSLSLKRGQINDLQLWKLPCLFL